MVDGIDNGETVDGIKSRVATQHFRDAELIIALINSEKEIPQGKDCAYFKAWAKYGNCLVETKFDEYNIQTTAKNPKVIWAHKKPYILNGDQ